MLTLLIDADTDIYTCAAANEKAVDWDGNGEMAYASDFPSARDQLRARIEDYKADLMADDVIVCLTDYQKPNFRKAVYPNYKSKRGPKPQMLPELRSYLMDHYTCYVRPGLEADDICGILATHPTIIKGDKIVVSIDKDLRTVPGLLFNRNHPEDGVVGVSKFDAYLSFLTQTLVGDSTDNYPGCPGVGPKRAQALLDSVYSVWGATPLAHWVAVVNAFESRGLTADDAITQARCARILHASDYNFKTRKPILWHPKTISEI